MSVARWQSGAEEAARRLAIALALLQYTPLLGYSSGARGLRHGSRVVGWRCCMPGRMAGVHSRVAMPKAERRMAMLRRTLAAIFYTTPPLVSSSFLLEIEVQAGQRFIGGVRGLAEAVARSLSVHVAEESKCHDQGLRTGSHDPTAAREIKKSFYPAKIGLSCTAPAI